MFATNVERVPRNTCSTINEHIRRQTDASVARYAAAGPETIGRRLAKLDEEWDTERCLETMAPTITLIGITLGLAVNRKWFALPLLVQSFFLQHALQGWCPPLPILRRLGVRTAAEIEEERYALKALRADFREVSERSDGSNDVMNAVRK
jgi:hypothetical protein